MEMLSTMCLRNPRLNLLPALVTGDGHTAAHVKCSILMQRRGHITTRGRIGTHQLAKVELSVVARLDYYAHVFSSGYDVSLTR